jgi:N6-adenosine-specific RNA methylase IME4
VATSSGGIAFRVPPRCGFVLGNLLDTASHRLRLEGGNVRCPNGLVPLVSAGRRFSFITLDPPWPSQSVRRAGTYATIPHRATTGTSTLGTPGLVSEDTPEDGAPGGVRKKRPRLSPPAVAPGLEALVRLPLGSLADATTGCLVGVWVTNNRALVDAVSEVLLPAWGAMPLGTGAYWLKVAATGEPVTPLGAGISRRPFERLVLGWIPPCGHRRAPVVNIPTAVPVADAASAFDSPSAERGDQDCIAAKDRVVPPSFPCHVLLSMPLRHSWKPPVEDILDSIFALCLGSTSGSTSTREADEVGVTGAQSKLQCGGSKLELFARELHPGWTSVGDQVILFQQHSFFRASDVDTSRSEAGEPF